jgi:triacylglycerol esterase/lipase EstA (alpha/beta hydrolase family)
MTNQAYRLYPKRIFDTLVGTKEITIMIHGLRNNTSGALTKFVIAKRKLVQLGYKNPVIGYSYDSNTTGAQYILHALHALHVGVIIANKNGRNLAKFVTDFKQKSPETKIRLMGHSLGAHVILSMIKNLAKNTRNKGIIEAVYLFGGSIPSDALSVKNASYVQKIVCAKIRNYYSPYDEVLRTVDDWNWADTPIGYKGAYGKTISKYSQTMVKPKNHRFASYAAVLRSFP